MEISVDIPAILPNFVVEELLSGEAEGVSNSYIINMGYI